MEPSHGLTVLLCIIVQHVASKSRPSLNSSTLPNNIVIWGAKYYRKHHLRHTKPFLCLNTSCTRKEGFSTVNDLNRHKQSKHPGDLSGEIHTKTYHCLVSGCKSQDKSWPRLDNFRSHLKRMHRLSEDAMDHFVHRSVTIRSDRSTLLMKGVKG